MAKLNRADIIKKLHKVLKKHFTPVPTPHDRTVLEHVLFACCLEDTRHELAEECFARVQQLYFDWNEIRVTTTRELSEVFAALPDPMAAATRLKSSLQSIFETRYEFDLEFLKKMKLGDAQKKLASLRGPSMFVQSYVTQASLGGHAIPTSAGSLQVLELIGAATGAEVAGGIVPGLDRAIPKHHGIEFGSLLHTLGSHFTAEPKSAMVKGVLAEVNAESVERLAKLLARKAAPPEPTSVPTDRRSDKQATKAKEPDPRATKGRERPADKSKQEPAGKAEPAKPSTPGKSTPPAAAVSSSKHPSADKPVVKHPADKGGRPTPAQPSGEAAAKGAGKAQQPATAKEVKKPTPSVKPALAPGAPSKSEAGKSQSGSAVPSKPDPASSSKPSATKAAPAKPSSAKPISAKPISAKPISAKPISGKPISTKPSDAKSSSVKPSSTKPDGTKPSSTKPSTAKPDTAKSSSAKPTSAKPTSAKPDVDKSGRGNRDSVKPNSGKSDASKLEAGKHKPDAGKQPAAKPEAAKPAERKSKGAPTKPPAREVVEGKSSEGKSSDAGASKSKTASKQLTRRKPR